MRKLASFFPFFFEILVWENLSRDFDILDDAICDLGRMENFKSEIFCANFAPNFVAVRESFQGRSIFARSMYFEYEVIKNFAEGRKNSSFFEGEKCVRGRGW